MTTNPNMHTENMADNGDITDSPYAVDCHYYEFVGLKRADGYLRVFGDATGHYSETRVDEAELMKAGWTRTRGKEAGREEFGEMESRVKEMSLAAMKAAIEASHPCTLETDKSYAADALAMELIHGRHDKREIVNMIRWVLMGCPAPDDKLSSEAVERKTT